MHKSAPPWKDWILYLGEQRREVVLLINQNVRLNWICRVEAGVIYFTPLFEKEWRGKARHYHFSLETAHFPLYAYPGCVAQVLLSGRPHPVPFPMSALRVCDTTEMPYSVLPFCLQHSTAVRYMQSGGLFWFSFFFPPPLTTEKTNSCITLHTTTGHKQGAIHHSPTFPVFAQGSV